MKKEAFVAGTTTRVVRQPWQKRSRIEEVLIVSSMDWQLWIIYVRWKCAHI